MELSEAEKAALANMVRHNSIRAVPNALTQVCDAEGTRAADEPKDKTLAERWWKVTRKVDNLSTAPCIDDV